MSLKYTSLHEIKFDSVSINGLNQAIRKLLENDASLVVNGNGKPTLWEKTWFNNQEVQGYSKGQTVWLNTDTPEMILSQRKNDIIEYLMNSKYRTELISLSSQGGDVGDFLLNVIDGRNGYDRLFYLGDIRETVQIRMSIKDNNKTTPDDDESWVSTFNLSSEQDYRDVIEQEFRDSYERNLSFHMEKYHLPGTTYSDITSTYLVNDFSNVTKSQYINTHTHTVRPAQMDGFDAVKISRYVKGANGMKWFRLWTSGYLEHGGCFSRNDDVLTVKLDWDYMDGTVNKKAPCFDYQRGFETFYAQNSSIDEVDITLSALDQKYTYNINVSQRLLDSNVNSFPSHIEIFNITNNGFQFKKTHDDVKSYQYYASGFLTTPTMRKYS